MDCERNKLLDIAKYIESLGVDVNIGKNKARGNKGFFTKYGKQYRIDISKNLKIIGMLSTLLHEFAHFIHFKYDESLKSLDFVFGELTEEEMEELLKVTINNVPRDFALLLFNKKEDYVMQNKELIKYIKSVEPDFKVSVTNKFIEKNIPTPAKYLIKYDRIKVYKQIYNIENLEKDFKNLSRLQISYIRLKNNQRKISNINKKINNLNKYYNQPSELWARFFELYFTNKELILKLAPNIMRKFERTVDSNSIKEITVIDNILKDSI